MGFLDDNHMRKEGEKVMVIAASEVDRIGLMNNWV